MNTSQLQEFSTHFYQNASAPNSFLISRYASQTIGISAALMLILLSVIVSKALGRKANKMSRVKSRTLKLLLGNLSFSILACIWNVSITSMSYVEPMFCISYAGIGGFLYIISNFFAYLLLMKRAQACQNIKQFSRFGEVAYSGILMSVKFGTAAVPVLAVVALFRFKGEIYFFEGLCVVSVDQTLCWILLLFDTILSLEYLLLFILPLWDHIHTKRNSVLPVKVPNRSTENSGHGNNEAKYEVSKNSKSDRIKATARRNLLISGAAIGSTFLYIGGLAGIAMGALKWGDDNANLPKLHMLNWQHYASVGDLFINSICALIMFKRLWAPTDKYRTSKGTPNLNTDTSGVTLQGADNPYHKGDSSLAREPLFPDEEMEVDMGLEPVQKL